jgi:hypothetical protein
VAVGQNYIGEAVNGGIIFVNKVTGQFYEASSFNNLFGTTNLAYLDPTLNYDPGAHAFVLTALTTAGTPNALDFALIPDANPQTFQATNTNDFVSIGLNAPNANFPAWGDYDHVGWNKDAYFIAMNMFATDPPLVAGNGFHGVHVITISKNTQLNLPSRIVTAPQPESWDTLDFSSTGGAGVAGVRMPDGSPASAGAGWLPGDFNSSVIPAIMNNDTQGGTMWFVGTPIPGLNGDPTKEPVDLTASEVADNVGGSYVNVIRLQYNPNNLNILGVTDRPRSRN